MSRRRKTDTPTRGEVTEKVEKNKEEMEEGVEQLDITATDTETVRETLENLDFEGTAEGTDAIEEAVEQAEDVTIDIFNGEDEELSEFIDSEVKEHEQELQERSDASESDFEKVSDAADRIATDQTKDELEHAKTEIRDDMEFIDEQQQASREAREENEQLQQQHRNRVHGGGR
ncbi:MAG: hypothetical protein AMJ75_02575 [Phycisphaerae bacterium SM1_79]|nr:MAG: hypothetical protein AMJ75_02575 [Phycisphaerae bacterium SM1_79]